MTAPLSPASVLAPSGSLGTARPATARNDRTAAAAPVFELRRIASGEMAIPIAVLGILLAMVVPLPPFLMDLLLSANITLSVIVLMVSMYIRRPADFNVFPAALLLMTLFRLALNVSSARLILLYGSRGTAAAGHVIEAFGQFVVGGNYVIGVVIFLVLIAIQYVVINHGAVRISEVTARFTLDALPGKQMSIDADLSAGLINEAEAKARRKSLAAEAEFYGAMDGATRFTQRDAIASLIITAINIIAGFLIGVLQHDMALRDALATYTVLTIGDGLVTVIPALMISISGGLIVTRAGSDQVMGTDFAAQLFSAPQPLALATGVLAAMALMPGLPKFPFILLAGTAGFAAWRLHAKERASQASAPKLESAPARENLDALLKVEPLAIELGLGLVSLAEGGTHSPLLRRIGSIRRQLAQELGFMLPSVRVTDQLGLKVREYAVRLKGIEIARFELTPGCELAVGGRGGTPPGGIPMREPAFGLAGFWVPSKRAEEVRRDGWTVVDALSILSTHLTELLRRHAWELFNRQEAKKYLDRVAEENPRVVEDLVPKLLPLATVQKIIQNLLRERVTVRDSITVLEAISEAAALTRNPVLMTEYVRQVLRRALVQPYLDADGQLPAFLIEPSLERRLEDASEHGETSSQFHLAPEPMKETLDAVDRTLGEARTSLAVLTGSASRMFLRQLIEGKWPNAAVLAHGEVPPGLRVVSLGVIGAART